MKKGLLILAAASLLCGASAIAEEPSIVLTFAEGTESARLGIGGPDAKYSVDWGNGEVVDYEGEGYYTGTVLGTVKIYGDSIRELLANSQNILTADLTKAGKLQTIQLNNNGMTSLELGEYPEMKGLYASENKLTTLNIEGCYANKVFDLHSNQLEGTFDFSKMTRLSTLTLYDNKITGVILPDGLSTVYNVDLSINEIETLTAENLTGMIELNCGENKLTSITLKNLPYLEELYVEENQLTELDLSGCPYLEKVMVAENQLTAIDLSVCPEMEGVYVQDNKLTALDLSANPGVRYININNNSIKDLDLSKQANLSLLNAENNGITEIDLSANNRLSTLNLNSNELTSINLAGKSSLSTLKLANNKLTEIDVKENGYLFDFDISNNQLTSIFLENNPYIYYLYVANNNLTELDIEVNNLMWRLDASGNKLTSLNIVQQVNLRQLLLQNNGFNADAINEIITDLPTVGYEVDDNNKDWMRQLDLSYNPGTSGANVAKAEDKGWFVTADFKSTAIAAPVVDTNADVVETLYYNAAGVSSATPFKGFNIRVDVLSNGTTRTSKAVVK